MNLSSRSAGWVFLALIPACSAQASGGPLAAPDATSQFDATTASNDGCAQLCARVVLTPGCPSDLSACSAQCAGLTNSTACVSASSAFFSCARTSPITCFGSTPTFSACESQLSTLAACVSSTPGADGGAPPDQSERDVKVFIACRVYNMCGPCLLGDGCGWCNGRCYDGTAQGPSSPGACGASPWLWGIEASTRCTP